MANLEIQVDDSLKEQAQAIFQNMGIDISTAIRIFLAKTVEENDLPFCSTSDPFFSQKNQEALLRSMAQIKSGQTITKTLEELRSME